MESASKGVSKSYNLIADMTGTTFPKQYMVTSGHIDSWDVGQVSLFIFFLNKTNATAHTTLLNLYFFNRELWMTELVLFWLFILF